MGTCDCEDIRKRLEDNEAERDAEQKRLDDLLDEYINLENELENLREELDYLIEVREKFLKMLRKPLPDWKRKQIKLLLKRLEQWINECENAIAELESQLEELEGEIEDCEVQLEMLGDICNAIWDELENCESNLIPCDACGEEFIDDTDCIKECEGCGRMYCVNCFDPAIEKAELAAGEPF